MRRSIGMLVAATTAVGVVGGALLAPPVVPAPAPPSDIAVGAENTLAAPGYDPERGDGPRAAVTRLYVGEIGPTRPIEVASIKVETGRYLFRFLIAGRFSALTEDGVACYLAEERSGIALEPKLTITLSREDGWTALRSDVPMSLPAMTVAANCSTAATSFGRLEVLQATLVAEPMG